jgi:hypothetical protein
MPALALLAGAPGGAGAAAPDPGTEEGAPRYDLRVTVEPKASRLEARGTLTIAPADQAREQIRISIGDIFADSLRMEIIAPAELAGPLTWGAKEVFGSVIAWNVRPKKPIGPGARLVLAFSYSRVFTNKGGDSQIENDVFKIAPEGAFANGGTWPWYPQIIYPVILNPPIMGEVRYRLIGDETFLSSGTESTDGPDRKQSVRRFTVARPGHFGFAAAHYHVRAAQAGLPLFTYLVTPRPHIDRALPRVGRMMALLQQWFGPYPQGAVKIAEAPTKGRFGSTADSLMFVGSGLLDGAWDDTFYAHEISHAWFGGKFNADRWIAGEGLANHAALRIVEALYGAPAARQFRLYGRPGYNELHCALGYFRLAAAGYDVPLAAKEQLEITYSKGMLVLDMLSRRLGRARFDSVLRALMDAHPFGTQAWPSVEQAFSRAAGEDLGWYFSQWMERKGAPDLALEWSRGGGGIRGPIRQSGDTYQLSIPLAVRMRGGRIIERTVEADSRALRFPRCRRGKGGRPRPGLHDPALDARAAGDGGGPDPAHQGADGGRRRTGDRGARRRGREAACLRPLGPRLRPPLRACPHLRIGGQMARKPGRLSPGVAGAGPPDGRLPVDARPNGAGRRERGRSGRREMGMAECARGRRRQPSVHARRGGAASARAARGISGAPYGPGPPSEDSIHQRKSADTAAGNSVSRGRYCPADTALQDEVRGGDRD